MHKVKTIVYLDKEYANVKPTLVYVLTSPSGNVKITHLLALTTDMKRLFDDAGIKIEEQIISRDVNEKNIQIEDITVNRIAPDAISYESDSEDEARKKYLKLKGRLPDYRFLGHECETSKGEPCSRFKSQKRLDEQTNT